MKRISSYLWRLTVPLCLVQPMLAQGYDTPLNIQGLDRRAMHSAASSAVGGTSLVIGNDLGVMFTNPAALHTLSGIKLSLGGAQQQSSVNQEQHYAPLKYYSNFSLLMEGLTHLIPDPDPLLVGTGPRDTVQRPYDTIGPNWSRKKDKGIPLHALIAVPFSLGETKFVAGAGAVQYADLHHSYQNNNVLSPSILSQRPLPFSRPPNDSIPIITQWSQYMRLRDGSLRGYGASLSAAVSDEIAFGVSGLVLSGSTDDFEQRVARGRLTFYTNAFRLDSVYGHFTNTGTSDYKATELTVSGVYRGEYLSVGASVRPPMMITHTFTTDVRVDTTGIPISTIVNGEEKIRLPWRGSVGLAIIPHENVTLGFEYEFRPYESATYTTSGGVESKPWLSASVARVGVEFRPVGWLALRGGVRGQAEVFEAEGNPLPGEAVTHSIYSGGVGISYAGIRLNLTYEYGQMKYQDIWGSAISLNTEKRHTFLADVTYEIPWRR
jgi:opacity protein-like surface antigen